MFGFTKDTYEGESKYMSERKNKFDNSYDEYSMYIQDDITDKPVCTVTKNGKIKYYPVVLKDGMSIEHLVVKFKHKDSDKEVQFGDKPHRYQVQFTE